MSLGRWAAALAALTFAACDPDVVVGHARSAETHDAAMDGGRALDATMMMVVPPTPPADAGQRDAMVMMPPADTGPPDTGIVDSGVPRPGPRSQLNWVSGAHTGNVLDSQAEFETWRGRPNDVAMYFVDRTTGWPGIVTPSWPIDMLAPLPSQLILSLPLYPEGMGNNKDCAAGMYDSEWRKLGPYMADHDRADTIIRLGWGPNDSDHYWHADDDPSDWVACYQHVAGAIRDTGPSLEIAWDFNVAGTPNTNALDPYSAYPGDDYVDYVGVEAFDMSPPTFTEPEWDAKCSAPTSLCTVIDFARAHGKRLGLSEWGLVSCNGDPGNDNAFFIQKMFDTFTANAGVMGFESYYQNYDETCSGLTDGNDHPIAGKRYQELYAKP